MYLTSAHPCLSKRGCCSRTAVIWQVTRTKVMGFHELMGQCLQSTEAYWISATVPATVRRFKSIWQSCLKCLLSPGVWGSKKKKKKSADVWLSENRPSGIRWAIQRQPWTRLPFEEEETRNIKNSPWKSWWMEKDGQGLGWCYGRWILATEFIEDSGKAWPMWWASSKPKISSITEAGNSWEWKLEQVFESRT